MRLNVLLKIDAALPGVAHGIEQPRLGGGRCPCPIEAAATGDLGRPIQRRQTSGHRGSALLSAAWRNLFAGRCVGFRGGRPERQRRLQQPRRHVTKIRERPGWPILLDPPAAVESGGIPPIAGERAGDRVIGKRIAIEHRSRDGRRKCCTRRRRYSPGDNCARGMISSSPGSRSKKIEPLRDDSPTAARTELGRRAWVPEERRPSGKPAPNPRNGRRRYGQPFICAATDPEPPPELRGNGRSRDVLAARNSTPNRPAHPSPHRGERARTVTLRPSASW